MTTNYEQASTVLELKNISLSPNFADTLLLDNISLKIGIHEKIGIIGANGAGKSTLLKLLNYLHTPTQGQFLFQEKSIANINPLQLRQKVVLVPQEPKLLGMTVQSALIYPLQLQKLSNQEIKQRLLWCLETLSIPESWLSRPEGELSLGQKQLVSIARGIIMNPQVLLLDEPTSALDVGKSDLLREKLIELSTNNIMTIVVVNHDLKWIKSFCDRLVWLEQGRIKQDWTRDQVNWQIVEENLSKRNLDQDFDNF